MSPEETLTHLKATISARCHKALDAIFAVCQEQVQRGLNDFSYATISRLGVKKGVPKAQSIRNKTGDSYKSLIKAFVDSVPDKKIRKNNTKTDSWIDEIRDPKLKLLVAIQASELKEARRMLREIVPPGLEIVIDDRTRIYTEQRFSDSERSALEYILSKDFMSEWKFSEGKRGEIVDADGNRAFKVATTDAIRKALRYL